MTPKSLQQLFDQGENISATLRDQLGVDHNTQEVIEKSYDIQTGSYIAALEKPSMLQHKADYTSEIARVILSLCQPHTILEAGVGEATTLQGVMQKLGDQISYHGFDISWSRLAYARRWLNTQKVSQPIFCTGDLFNIPYLDNTFDVVYTSHSIEPNRGDEKKILEELFRVTKNYLILLEPGYELCDDTARQRMDEHRYCRQLQQTALTLNYQVLRHELFPFSSNPQNPTAITIIKKNSSSTSHHRYIFACPKFKTPLLKIDENYFSEEALVVYPSLAGIPCLRIENGIFASKYQEIIEDST